jgi:hypothetical protein
MLKLVYEVLGWSGGLSRLRLHIVCGRVAFLGYASMRSIVGKRIKTINHFTSYIRTRYVDTSSVSIHFAQLASLIPRLVICKQITYPSKDKQVSSTLSVRLSICVSLTYSRLRDTKLYSG